MVIPSQSYIHDSVDKTQKVDVLPWQQHNLVQYEHCKSVSHILHTNETVFIYLSSILWKHQYTDFFSLLRMSHLTGIVPFKIIIFSAKCRKCYGYHPLRDTAVNMS